MAPVLNDSFFSKRSIPLPGERSERVDDSQCRPGVRERNRQRSYYAEAAIDTHKAQAAFALFSCTLIDDHVALRWLVGDGGERRRLGLSFNMREIMAPTPRVPRHSIRVYFYFLPLVLATGVSPLP